MSIAIPCVFSYIFYFESHSPTPNAYFAKYANLESPADSGVNSEYHSHVSEKVKHEQASNGLTEETTELPSVAQGTDGNLTSPVMSTELTDEELTTESQTEDHSSILGTDDNGRGITESESTDANEDLLYPESVNGDTEQTDVSRMSLEEECTVLNQHSRVCNGGNRQNVSQTSNAVTWISCMVGKIIGDARQPQCIHEFGYAINSNPQNIPFPATLPLPSLLILLGIPKHLTTSLFFG